MTILERNALLQRLGEQSELLRATAIRLDRIVGRLTWDRDALLAAGRALADAAACFSSNYPAPFYSDTARKQVDDALRKWREALLGVLPQEEK